MDAKILSYLEELAADIAEHGGLDGKTLEQALTEAHARRQAFLEEIATGSTTRARMFREALIASTWATGRMKDACADALYNCHLINNGQV